MEHAPVPAGLFNPAACSQKISLQKYKTVFVGSDQVWNPEITVGLDDAYTGSIPQRGSCRLAAYGASMGGAALSEADRRKFAAHVGNGFSAVSLREKINVESVEQMLGGNGLEKRPVNRATFCST